MPFQSYATEKECIYYLTFKRVVLETNLFQLAMKIYNLNI